MNIAIERNLDMKLIDREGYTVLDYLSDMGGMQNIVQSVLIIVLSFWNYNFLDDFLVSKLFRYEKNPDSKKRPEQQSGGSEPLVPHKCDNPKACLRDRMPKCMVRSRACREDYRVSAFRKARNRLLHDLNATELIK